MRKCELCKIANANKTGAHIIPDFLIRNILNLNQIKKRSDKQVIFNLSEDFNKTFYGREVNTKELLEFKGEELSESEEGNNQNPITVDNFWCTECENKFGIVEHYFVNKVLPILERISIENEVKAIEIEGIDNGLIRLFIYSIIWRAAITKNSGFKLNWKLKNKLREILYENLQLRLVDTLFKSKKNKAKITALPLIINYLTNKDRTTNQILLHKNSHNPCFFLINYLSCQLYFKKIPLRPKMAFFGITDHNSSFKFINFKERQLLWAFLGEEASIMMNKKATESILNERVKTNIKQFSGAILHFLKRQPTTSELDWFKHNFFVKTNPYGYKGSFKHFHDLVKELLMSNGYFSR